MQNYEEVLTVVENSAVLNEISVSNPMTSSLADVSLDDLLEEVEDLTEEEALPVENSAVLNELSDWFISLIISNATWYSIFPFLIGNSYFSFSPLGPFLG